MAFHAYTKYQFEALDFDTTGYFSPGMSEVGDYCARLDCKRWGTYRLFLYLTLWDGQKLFITVPRGNFTDNQYMGFLDIPIGGIVNIGLDSFYSSNAYLCSAEWLPNQTDEKEAEAKMSGEWRMSGTTREAES